MEYLSLAAVSATVLLILLGLDRIRRQMDVAPAVFLVLFTCVVGSIALAMNYETMEVRGDRSWPHVGSCYAAMMMGMAAQYLFYDYRRNRFSLLSFVRPFLASPIVFIPLLGVLNTTRVRQFDSSALMVLLLSFQTGFFWRHFFATQERRLNRKRSSSSIGPPAAIVLALSFAFSMNTMASEMPTGCKLIERQPTVRGAFFRNWCPSSWCASTRSYALIAGVSRFTADWSNLDGVRADTTAVADYLSGSQEFDAVVVCQDEAVTAAALSELVEDYFVPKLGDADRFVLYFAGHGVRRRIGAQEKGYLVLSGSHRDDWSSLLSMGVVADWLQKIGRARHVLALFDVCGAALVGEEVRGDHVLRALSEKRGGFLIAAGGTQDEALGSPQQGGYFTSAFLDAVRGLADFDKNAAVTVSEAFAYVKNSVLAKTDGQQTPRLFQLFSDGGEFFFPTRPASRALDAVRPQPASNVESRGEPLGISCAPLLDVVDKMQANAIDDIVDPRSHRRESSQRSWRGREVFLARAGSRRSRSYSAKVASDLCDAHRDDNTGAAFYRCHFWSKDVSKAIPAAKPRDGVFAVADNLFASIQQCVGEGWEEVRGQCSEKDLASGGLCVRTLRKGTDDSGIRVTTMVWDTGNAAVAVETNFNGEENGLITRTTNCAGMRRIIDAVGLRRLEDVSDARSEAEEDDGETTWDGTVALLGDSDDCYSRRSSMEITYRCTSHNKPRTRPPTETEAFGVLDGVVGDLSACLGESWKELPTNVPCSSRRVLTGCSRQFVNGVSGMQVSVVWSPGSGVSLVVSQEVESEGRTDGLGEAAVECQGLLRAVGVLETGSSDGLLDPRGRRLGVGDEWDGVVELFGVSESCYLSRFADTGRSEYRCDAFDSAVPPVEPLERTFGFLAHLFSEAQACLGAGWNEVENVSRPCNAHGFTQTGQCFRVLWNPNSHVSVRMGVWSSRGLTMIVSR